jgi:magnesium transporter
MITIYQKTVTDTHLKELSEFKIGSWIFVEDPSDKEINRLASEFKLEPTLLRDALDPNEVPRVEEEEGVTYIFTRVPHSVEGKVATVPMLVVLAESFILTLSQENLPIFKRIIADKVKLVTTQKTRAILQIFSEINTAYNAYISEISKRVRSLGINLERITNKDIIQFVNYEGILNDFLAALVPINAILKTLLSGKHLKLYEKDMDLTEDLLLGNEQLLVLCRGNLTTIVNIRQAYSVVMTNNLNRVIKLLTSLTVILTVPTMIASIYGMNVGLPFADSPLIFWIIVGVIVLIILALLRIFYRNDWL